MSRRLVVAAVVALSGCRDPTQITLELRSDVPCADIRETSIRGGAAGAVDDGTPSTATGHCQDGRIGSLVFVPSDDDEAEIAIEVTGRLGDVACADDAAECIVARRRLHYLPHAKLLLPIDLRASCKGVVCPQDQTCADGGCRPALIDPATCLDADGCDEGDLPPPAVTTPGVARGDGELWLGIRFSGAADFGTGTITSAGLEDAVLVHLRE